MTEINGTGNNDQPIREILVAGKMYKDQNFNLYVSDGAAAI